MNQFYKNNLVKIVNGVCVAILIALCVGCVTQEQPLPVIDYSDEKSLEYTITTITAMSESNLPLAIIQARRLKNERKNDTATNLYQTLIDRLRSETVSLFAEEHYSQALRNVQSLLVLKESLPEVDGTPLSVARVTAKITENRKQNGDVLLLDPSSTKKAAISHEKVSDYIQGTVTVWVNQGMKLQNGVSSPSIVIGSGFFIDPRGYIVTNYHVIQSEVDPEYEGFSRLYIKMSDDPETRIPAKVIGWDPVFDLALLKATVDVPYVFPLGSSSDLDTGDTIYAIGSPAGLERTLTSGIVSADNRRLLSMGSIMQIDAPINHGNSGGPIISRDGMVQAVVFAGVENFEGLNFAIPVEYLKTLLPKLYEGGKLEQPWLGAFGKDSKNIVAADGSTQSGVMLQYVVPTGSASVAGLPIDTLITAVNGKKVLTVQDIQTELIHYRPGQIITVTADGRDYPVSLAVRPDLPGKQVLDFDIKDNAFIPLMGMQLTFLGGRLKPKYSIQKIYPGSIADESGFSEQDPFTLLDLKVNEDAGAVYVRIDVQKRKNGFLESAIGFGLPLDSPDYF